MPTTLTIEDAEAQHEAYIAAREAAYDHWILTGDATCYARFA